MICRQPPVILLWISFLLVPVSLIAASDVVRNSPVPAWVKPVLPALAEACAEPISESPGGIEYLLVDSQTDMASAATSHHNVYRINSQAGLSDHSTIVLSFDPSYETVELHSIRIWREGVARDVLDGLKIDIIQQEKDLERNMFNGRLSAVVMLRDMRVGDIVDSTFTRKGFNPVFKGKLCDVIHAGWNSNVRSRSVRLLVPKGRSIHYANQGDVPLALEVIQSPQGSEYLWTGKSIKALAPDEDEPNWYIRFPYIEVSEYGSWQDVADWAVELFKPVEASPALKRQAETLGKKGNAYAKALALLDFVQREIRYMGIEMGPYSHQPNDPSEVLSRRYGDCKDKARLLCAMLSLNGLKGDPVLVNSYREKFLSEHLSSPFAFNHVIVRIEISGRHYFVDPTRGFQRGVLDDRLTADESMGLLVRRYVGDLVKIPASPSSVPKSVVMETYTFPVYDKPAQVDVVMTYSGDWAEWVRAYLASSSIEARNKYFTNFYKERHPGLERIAEVICSDDIQRNRVEVRLSFTVNGIWEPQKGSDGVMKAEFWHLPMREHYLQPASLARTSPLSLKYPFTQEVHTVIRMPDEWNLQRKDNAVESDFFNYKDHYFAKERSIHYNSYWRSTADHVPLARLQDYVSELAKVRSIVGLTLTRNTALEQQLDNAGVNTVMVMVSILALASGIGLGLWYNRSRRHALPPVIGQPAIPALGGWLILPAIGLVISPFILISSIVSQGGNTFGERAWLLLTSPTSSSYIPYWGFSVCMEQFLNILLLCWTVSCAYWFFRRRSFAPRAIIMLYVASCLVQGIDLSILIALFGSGEAGVPTTVLALIRTIIVASVWTPYFLLSKRVQRTFIA